MNMSDNLENDFGNDIEHSAMLEMGRHMDTSTALSQAFDGGLGGSPVSQLQQDQLMSIHFVQKKLRDIDGCLQKALQERILSSDTLFSKNLGHPMRTLAGLIQSIVDSRTAIEELTHKADMIYGRQYGERPIFQKSGQEANKDDSYTHQSVRISLENFLKEFTDQVTP